MPGFMKKDMIVVLNDNNMSIAPNVWAISNYFTELIADPRYNRFKKNVYDLTGKLDQWGDRIRRATARLEEGIKVIITPGMLFEALGFRYFGPINGHNMAQLVRIFQEVKDLDGPILVHAITQKGKGYRPAELDEQRLHGVTPFDKVTGVSPKKAAGPPAYTRSVRCGGGGACTQDAEPRGSDRRDAGRNGAGPAPAGDARAVLRCRDR